ncbi:unnamed protein product [Camellia sinensis]
MEFVSEPLILACCIQRGSGCEWYIYLFIYTFLFSGIHLRVLVEVGPDIFFRAELPAANTSSITWGDNWFVNYFKWVSAGKCSFWRQQVEVLFC